MPCERVFAFDMVLVQPREGTMDIGEVKRIIIVEPETLPGTPAEDPDNRPAEAPAPAEPDLVPANSR
jgi:hypothetical protein